MQDVFTHKEHTCIAFELLSLNLYEVIKENHFRGLPTELVRQLVKQLLEALIILDDLAIVHSDLKPENILLTTYVAMHTHTHKKSSTSRLT